MLFPLITNRYVDAVSVTEVVFITIFKPNNYGTKENLFKTCVLSMCEYVYGVTKL